MSANKYLSTFCNALRHKLSEEESVSKAAGLECEWNAHRNSSRDVTGASKISYFKHHAGIKKECTNTMFCAF